MTNGSPWWLMKTICVCLCISQVIISCTSWTGNGKLLQYANEDLDEDPWWPCVSLMRTLHGAFTNLVHSLFLAAALRFLSCTCMSQKESGNIKLMSLSTLLTHCHPVLRGVVHLSTNVHSDVYQIQYKLGSSCKLLNISLAWKHKNYILLGNLWQQELSKLCGIISQIF